MDVITAMRERISTRAFLDKPVSKQQISEILEAARWAPSGVNTQPWQVAVVRGNAKQAISEEIIAARESGQPENPDYNYYPQQWFEPYKGRRQACGIALYGALGIERQDKERRKEQWYKNYYFFGAPVGLFFILDKRMDKGSWVDMGLFLQNVMLAARGIGLETCPQAALAEYPDIVRNHLELDKNQVIVCGMALGYADPHDPVNQYRTDREEVEQFTRWIDFD